MDLVKKQLQIVLALGFLVAWNIQFKTPNIFSLNQNFI